MAKKRLVLDLKDFSSLRIICRNDDCRMEQLWVPTNAIVQSCAGCGTVFFSRHSNDLRDLSLLYLLQAMSDLRKTPDYFRYDIEFETDMEF